MNRGFWYWSKVRDQLDAARHEGATHERVMELHDAWSLALQIGCVETSPIEAHVLARIEAARAASIARSAGVAA